MALKSLILFVIGSKNMRFFQFKKTGPLKPIFYTDILQKHAARAIKNERETKRKTGKRESTKNAKTDKQITKSRIGQKVALVSWAPFP